MTYKVIKLCLMDNTKLKLKKKKTEHTKEIDENTVCAFN